MFGTDPSAKMISISLIIVKQLPSRKSLKCVLFLLNALPTFPHKTISFHQLPMGMLSLSITFHLLVLSYLHHGVGTYSVK